MAKSADASGTYVYCAIAARTAPSLAGLSHRLPGTGRVRLLEVKSARYLVVGSAPLARFGDEAMHASIADLDWVSRAAVAHEAVVESFLDADALLPMKLFTIFTSDDRAIAEIGRNWPRIERLLRRLARQVEWGVRVSFDDRRTSPSRSSNRMATARRQSGRDYLLAKRRMRGEATTRIRQARRQATTVYRTLAFRATAARRRKLAAEPGAGGRLVLDAAFLVASRQSARFSAKAARLTRPLAAAGLNLQITGPWPPYSFVERL